MDSNENEVQYSYKVVLIGDSGVGKTSLLTRFTKNQFSFEIRSTIGFQNAFHAVEIEGKIVKAEIWDTTGQERIRPAMNPFYRGAVGALLVFDITNAESFAGLNNWLNELSNFATNISCILLIGNKTDLESDRKVSQTKAIQFAQKFNNMMYIETSANTAENVNKAFETLLGNILSSTIKAKKVSGGEQLNLNGPAKRIEFEDMVENARHRKKRKRHQQDNPQCACALACSVF
ncbi:unnamed protein product [Blepharisma stoltei]|uniref:Uncharacterized protein n=1 Tax=Blepharisma stoltei TaxID=1481888 RepID=A0AAU9IS49_9CILI|nr:unnamed protein product [Blepharisma stoltei]